MKTLTLVLLLALAPSLSPVDMPGLALAIVEAARQDIGFGPTATHPPVATGPFFVDDLSFVEQFDFLGETAATDVLNALAAEGYAFESLGNLITEEVGNLGSKRNRLADDSILLRLNGMNTAV